jgi:hypothetical protein
MNRGFHESLVQVAGGKKGRKSSGTAQPSQARCSGIGAAVTQGCLASHFEVPLSTEAVHKSVDFRVFQGSFSGRNCTFVTLANY